jgi:hypothetical protein
MPAMEAEALRRILDALNMMPPRSIHTTLFNEI